MSTQKAHKAQKKSFVLLCLFVAKFLELESACDLDYAVQSAAADRVCLSNLTERWAVDVEDRVASPTQPQSRSKNPGQEVGVIQNVECVRTNLETHPFS